MLINQRFKKIKHLMVLFYQKTSFGNLISKKLRL